MKFWYWSQQFWKPWSWDILNSLVTKYFLAEILRPYKVRELTHTIQFRVIVTKTNQFAITPLLFQMTNIFRPTNNWLHMIVYICTTTPSLNFKNLNFTCAPTSVSRSASHWKLVRLPQGPAPTTPDQDSPATQAPSSQVIQRPPRPLSGRTGRLNEEADETSHLFWRRGNQVLVPCQFVNKLPLAIKNAVFKWKNSAFWWFLAQISRFSRLFCKLHNWGLLSL